MYMTPKELRQFQLAMKNSLLETENVNAELEEIEEMKTYRPSEEEFKDPLVYIDKIMREEDACEYGCVKIVPPASFKPPLAFDTQSDAKLPTRYQILQDLSQGKAFKQNNVGRSFSEFNDIARQHE